ncbi:MAG: hypothetical protein JWQ96_1839, partial [Segetibacter sp.]|nr:hypothetical protein [Segetibacter sp.]
ITILFKKGMNKRIELLMISPLYMSKEKQEQINKKLEQLTQLVGVVK